MALVSALRIGAAAEHPSVAAALPLVVLAAALACITITAAATPAVPESPTFTRDIAPILFRTCIVCHHPGTNTAFSLLTYENVRPRARLIAAATQSKYMPPWKPEPGFGDDFIGRRGLSNVEIATIQQWVNGGARLGDPGGMAEAATFGDAWRLGARDLVFQ